MNRLTLLLCAWLLAACGTLEVGIEAPGQSPAALQATAAALATENATLRAQLELGSGRRERLPVLAYDPENGARLVAFAPGDPQGDVLAALPDTYAEISPDGEWIAYGDPTPEDPARLAYGRVGEAPRAFTQVSEMPGAPAYRLTGLAFNRESTHLAFTRASERDWALVLLELETGEALLFGGVTVPPTDPLPANGFYGAARVIGWLAGNGGLVFEAFMPGGADRLGGPMLFDFTGLTLDVWTELPAAQPVFRDTAELERAVFYRDPLSPDGSGLLYLVNDPTRPLTNYPPQVPGTGGGLPPNTLAVIDTRTGAHRVIGQADAGEGIAAASWMPDGRRVVMLTGDYENTFFIPDPRVVMVDADGTAPPVVGPSLRRPDGVRQSAGTPVVCGETLFFSASISPSEPESTLASIPLDAPNETYTPLLQAPILTLLGTCIP